jgi:hypothetical protein
LDKEYFYFRHSVHPERKYLAKLNPETNVYGIHEEDGTFLASFTHDEIVQKIGIDWKIIDGDDLDNVFSASEAVKLWGLCECAVRQAYKRGLFNPGEAKKSGAPILVTRGGMHRLYGPQPKKE